MFKLSVSPDAPRFIKECAVDLAHVLGFRSVSMEFPLLAIGAASGPDAMARPGVLTFALRHTGTDAPAWSIERSTKAAETVDLASRDAASCGNLLAALLESFGEIEASPDFSTDAGRYRASSVPAPERFEAPGAMASGYHPEPAARGLESLFERGFLVKDEDFDFLPDRVDVTVRLPDDFDDAELSAACDFAARFGMESLGIELPFLERNGDAQAGKHGSTIVIRRDAPSEPTISWQPSGTGGTAVLRGSGAPLAAFAASLCRNLPGTGDDSPLAALLDRVRGPVASTPTPPAPDPSPLVVERDFGSELDACREILARRIYPAAAGLRDADLTVIIGRGREVRADLAREITAACRAAGCLEPRVRVIDAFKQGFSWIRDHEIPELSALRGLHAVEIRFSAFLPDGRDVWNDEDGATPKIAPNRPDDPEAWLDSPIRLLQELYPIDDLIAAATGIPTDRITFTLDRESGPERGYRIMARGEGGEILRSATFSPAFAERPYLDEFPGLGKVHPGTGAIRLESGGALVASASFRTDLESVWDCFQKEILPAARALPGSTRSQPFFELLEIEVSADHPDEDAGVRQDRVSPLESLHEDLYFAGLDYFQTLGVKTAGKGFDAPGLILPVIRHRPGAPCLKAALHRAAAASSSAPASAPASAWVGEISAAKAGDSWTVRFGTGTGAEAATVAPAAFTLDPKTAARKDMISIESVEFPASDMIDPDRFESIAADLARVKGLRVRHVGTSRQGRPIRAVEFTPAGQGYVSRTKLVATRPTLYVNGRHHANEVSSTNSALMLIRRVLSDPSYARLADRLNLIVLPMENVDGAALHARLAADNPEWMLHAARYDSLGGEFAREYFNDATTHTEAAAFTRVWRDWLPDIVADDHGVPHHEWCQQFSGYTSPWFKGFWMPRALLYGYFWYATDARFSANRRVSEGIRDAVSARIGASPDFASRNAMWRERFEKYAHAWMPRLFPADYHRDMIFYWVPYAYDPAYYYTAVRFPWITASSFVSEVADETATGAYLGLCAEAHLEEDLAIIDMLAASEPAMEERTWREGARIRSRRMRIRPIDV